MTRVCVIGNSHSACLKLAWSALQPRYRSVSLTFFAQRGSGMDALAPRGSTLVPRSKQLAEAMSFTSGGLGVIDLDAYDVVLQVGFVKAYPPPPGHFSLGAARQAFLDLIPQSVLFSLLRKIRSISDIPVFIAHQPLRRYEGDDDADNDLGPYRRLIRHVNDELLRKEGAMFLEQPPQTIANYFHTRAEFAVGSPRLDVGDLADDADLPADARSHMNQRFGDIFLSTHLPRIASGQLVN